MRGYSIIVAPGSQGTSFPEFSACDVCKSCARRDRNNPDHQFDDAQISCVSTHVFSYRSMAPAGTPTDESLPLSIVRINVQFMSGQGDLQTVSFDLGEGTKVVLPGCTVRATVDYPAIADTTQPSITVFWSMGAGDSKDAPNTARYTVDVGVVNNEGTSAAFRIPAFADHATLETDNVTVATATLTQTDAAGTVVQAATVGKLDDLGVPLASRSTFFTVTNGGANAAIRISWRLIF